MDYNTRSARGGFAEMSEIKREQVFDLSALGMADNGPRDLKNRSIRPPTATLIAAAACVAAIALAGLALLFLQVPKGTPTRSPPVETAAVRTKSEPAAQLPERQGAAQAPTAAIPVTTPRILPAQAPTGSTSQTREPALSVGIVPRDERIAVPAAAPTVAPTTAEASNAPVRPNLERRQMVTLERSGVNIRLAPSASSRVVGSAPKGTRFEVKKRNGRWVEIESDAVKGWVSGHFLGPDQPGGQR
jgi:hypothetical protein